MADLEILHFEQLKTEVQAQYLKNHTPSHDDISKWKGIDIIYFQEDLRKVAKGNISEKSFYTYFKNKPITKVPRIDMLNLLSIYAGYASWYDFKKNHLFADEILKETEEETEFIPEETEEIESTSIDAAITEKSYIKEEIKSDIQISNSENQNVSDKSIFLETYDTSEQKPLKKSLKNFILGITTGVAAIIAVIFLWQGKIFDTTYSYCFYDADRNAPIQNMLEIKVFKENESPLYYRIKPGECFHYTTKDESLRMLISSPLHENVEVNRSLENAPQEENIELKPDDYKMAVDYFSKKSILGNPEESSLLIKQKRRELENRISDQAVIYQVFDSDIYGIETLDKQKYISLVTTPTTSLKNLSVIEMKTDKGKIVSIKFKITEDDENP